MKLLWLTSLLQISFEVHSAENRSGPVQLRTGGGRSLDVHSTISTHIDGNKAALSSELQKYIQNVSWLSVKDPRGGCDGTFGGKVDPGTVLYGLMSRAASFKGVMVHVGWKNRRFKQAV